jgi:hypothetical protein
MRITASEVFILDTGRKEVDVLVVDLINGYDILIVDLIDGYDILIVDLRDGHKIVTGSRLNWEMQENSKTRMRELPWI